ncbi:MAG: zinc ribbon domain-containing protein [Theionarchaea archaeon]|nr:zinc ribbon domain-containing protein [Theionarchaea archaeon]
MKWRKKVKCIKCGAENYPEFSFCTKCGHDLPLKERQSPYAIIFTIATIIFGILTSSRPPELFLLVIVVSSCMLLAVIWQILPFFRRLSEYDAPRIRRKW